MSSDGEQRLKRLDGVISELRVERRGMMIGSK